MSGGLTEGEEIVVVGRRPPMVDMGNDFCGRFYSDGIAQMSHYEGGWFGNSFGGDYVPQGNYTYEISNGAPSNATTNTLSANPSKSWTETRAPAYYKLTGRTDLP